jgi:hypothetical protein
MFRLMARWLLSLLVCFVALLLAGCGGSGTSQAPDPTIRFVNSIPDSTLIEFLLNDDVMNPALATPTFVRIEPGAKDVRIRESGTTVDIWNELGTFNSDRHYVILSFGIKNFGTEFEKRARIGGIDVNRSIPTGNKARIYVFHAYNRMTGFQTHDIDFQTPGENPQFKLADIAYGTQKSFLVDSGNQTFEVRRAGTTNVLFTTNVNLGAGKIYVALATGLEGEIGVQEPKIVFIELQPE